MPVLKDLLRSPAADRALRLLERTPLRRFVTSMTFDPRRGVLLGSGDMERDWDARARRNAPLYVAVDDADSPESFEESGRRHLQEWVLKGIDLPPDAIAVEIGCGLGRLLAPLSPLVREAHGVDISQEMLTRAREVMAAYPNVHLHHTDGSLSMFTDASVDFVFSYRVFLHFPEKSAVLRYFREAARVLKPGGLFRFQVCRSEDGRRGAHAGTWFGVLFTEDELRATLPRYDFEVLGMELEESPARQQLWEYLFVTCRRQPAP